MQILFSLANNTERLIRLINHLADKSYPITSKCNLSLLHQRAKGIFTVDLSGELEDCSSEQFLCHNVQIYLTNEQPALDLIQMILSTGGGICEEATEANLIICHDSDIIADFCKQYPRILVAGESELRLLLSASLSAGDLRARVDPHLTPVPGLPDHLKPCWAKLRRRSIAAINEGLALFDEAVQSDPTAGDALLDQVEVVEGGLYPGKRFRLNERFTHAYSYYALLGLLSRSPAGSRGEALRLGLKSLNQPWDEQEPLEIIVLPELRGFEGLEKIDIRILERNRTTNSPDCLSANWGALPHLKELRIDLSDKVTLDFDIINAPQLQSLTLRGDGFTEIQGISQCFKLGLLDVCDTAINDLSPISPVCRSLRDIRLSGSSVATLEPLGSCEELTNLELHHCRKITSLHGLEQSSLKAEMFEIENTGINTLHEFPAFEGESIHLLNIPISSLAGIAKACNLKTIHLKYLKDLKNIDELALLPSIEEIWISECPSLCDFEVLGSLPRLRYVSISDCTSLAKMPMRWPDTLRHLSLQNMAARQIGDLPTEYEENIDLAALHGLETLENFRPCTKVNEISLSLPVLTEIKDLSPLAKHDDLWINIQMRGESRISEDVVSLLASLPVCRLRLDNYSRITDIDLNSLCILENLTHLDLDDCQAITMNELRPIIGMNALEYLQFEPGSLPELGGCTFSTKGKIAKLKMQLLVS